MSREGHITTGISSLDLDKDQSQKTDDKTLSSISKLPRELLQDIFETIAASWHWSDWFPITQVCHTWREVAVGLSSLWTRPATHHYDLAELMLERSKTAELDIEIHTGTSKATTRMIMAQAERIKTLSITQPYHLLRSSFKALSQSIAWASRLEQIALFQIGTDEEGTATVSPISFQQLPRLRTVVFEHVGFDWAKLPLPNLTNLHLVNAVLPRNQPPTSLLRYLAQLPNLETISVSWHAVAFMSHLATTTDRNPVQLPRLTHADFQWFDFRSLEFILPQLAMPHLRSLHIAMVDLDFDCYPLINAISTILSNGDLSIFYSLFVTDHAVQLTEGSSHADRAPGLHFTTGRRFRPETFILIALRTFKPQVLSQITQLSFLMFSPTDRLLRLCSSNLPNVESIAIQHTDIDHLVDLPPQGLLDDVTFPNLIQITLYATGDIKDMKSWWELIDWLVLRECGGAPMQRLILIQLAPPRSDVQEALEGLDLEVIWRE